MALGQVLVSALFNLTPLLHISHTRGRSILLTAARAVRRTDARGVHLDEALPTLGEHPLWLGPCPLPGHSALDLPDSRWGEPTDARQPPLTHAVVVLQAEQTPTRRAPLIERQTDLVDQIGSDGVPVCLRPRPLIHLGSDDTPSDALVRVVAVSPISEHKTPVEMIEDHRVSAGAPLQATRDERDVFATQLRPGLEALIHRDVLQGDRTLINKASEGVLMCSAHQYLINSRRQPYHRLMSRGSISSPLKMVRTVRSVASSPRRKLLSVQ